MKIKISSLITFFTISLSCLFYGCNQSISSSREFDFVTKDVTSIVIEEDLPSEITNYSPAETGNNWMKIAEAENSDIAIFTNLLQTEKFYLRTNGTFYELDWLAARANEADIKLYLSDIDNDSNDEIIAVLKISGGAHSAKEEIHILSPQATGVKEIVFPMEQVEEWIIDNTKSNSEKIIFFDDTVELKDKTINNKLADTIYYRIADFAENTFSVEVIIDNVEIKSVAVLRCNFSYNAQKFVLESFDLTDFV